MIPSESVEVLLMGETFIVLGETILVLGETICAKLVMGETRYNLFSLSHTRDKTKKTSFFFLPSPKLTIFLILYTF